MSGSGQPTRRSTQTPRLTIFVAVSATAATPDMHPATHANAGKTTTCCKGCRLHNQPQDAMHRINICACTITSINTLCLILSHETTTGSQPLDNHGAPNPGLHTAIHSALQHSTQLQGAAPQPATILAQHVCTATFAPQPVHTIPVAYSARQQAIIAAEWSMLLILRHPHSCVPHASSCQR